MSWLSNSGADLMGFEWGSYLLSGRYIIESFSARLVYRYPLSSPAC